MIYHNIHAARFLARPNRFIAQVELDGAVETVHVKNTGRCRELLLPGCTVYLEGSANPARKTKYDLVAVEKERPGLPLLLINMDAQAPNRVFREWMGAGLGEALGLPRPTLLRPETPWGRSRFDFYWERTDVSRETSVLRKGFVEVKGCTLEEDGLALLLTGRYRSGSATQALEEDGLALVPDAPTQRGVKHLRELAACREAGYEAAVCVVVQMAGMTAFSPNDRTHPQFGSALREAARAGVRVLAVECAAAPDSLTITGPVPVRL